MRSLVLAAAAGAAAAAANAWNLRLLSLKTSPMAQCLDGTPGGYWAFNGTGADASKWIIHLQGGGWCVNEEDCVGRSKSSLGSSSFWLSEPEPTADGGVAGLFNSDGAINPYYANWTKMCVPPATARLRPHLSLAAVLALTSRSACATAAARQPCCRFVGYCDGARFVRPSVCLRGGSAYRTPTQAAMPLPHLARPSPCSFAGTVAAPQNISGTIIYFRGRYILDAVINDLLGAMGLASASEIVLSGCSAGGLATYIHADYFGSRMPPAARYTALPGACAPSPRRASIARGTRTGAPRLPSACLRPCPPAHSACSAGAGFFLDTPSYGGGYIYTPIYQYVFNMQNVTGSVNQDCIAYYSAHGGASALWHW